MSLWPFTGYFSYVMWLVLVRSLRRALESEGAYVLDEIGEIGTIAPE